MTRIVAPQTWTWTQGPLNPHGARVVLTSDLFAASPSLGQKARGRSREDCLEEFDRVSIGRAPRLNPPPGSSEIRPARDIYLSLEDHQPPPSKLLPRSAVIITPHPSMGRFLLHHYAGAYEQWRFDRLLMQHQHQVEVLAPDQTMLLEPRCWYRLRFGAIHGYVPDDVARAYLDAFAHTELWLWLDDPDMKPARIQPPPKEGGTDPPLPEPDSEFVSPVRNEKEARVVAHAYGHLLAGHPWVLTAGTLADHAEFNDLDDLPTDTKKLTYIIRNVVDRLKRDLGMDRHGPPTPSTTDAGLLLLNKDVLALMGDYVVVRVSDDRASQAKELRVSIVYCHARLQKRSENENANETPRG
jgi:hypothetical protein